jgi:Short C-terminal domain
MRRLLAACGALGLALSLLLSSCGGGGAKTENVVTTKSKGEQLSDLQKAYESGALSRDEYEKQRKKILEQP